MRVDVCVLPPAPGSVPLEGRTCLVVDVLRELCGTDRAIAATLRESTNTVPLSTEDDHFGVIETFAPADFGWS